MKEIEIWAPNDMPPEVLEAEIAVLRSQGNRVIVYRSGHGNLVSLTSELLRLNRDLELPEAL